MAQVGERKDLLQRLLARVRGHARGHPQPQRVEVAVERVGLASCRSATARAGGVDELVELGQRVAGARRAQVEGQDHRQLLARDGHGAALLAVDDRDRRAPRALAGDDEVRGAVAHRLARASRHRSSGGRRSCGCPLSSASPSGLSMSGTSRPSRRAITSSVRSSVGTPSTIVGPKRESTSGETSTGSGAPSAPRTTRPVSITGIVSASRELRSQPPERSCSSCSRTRVIGGPHVGVWMARGHQHEARLGRGRRGEA